jgi:hypothetical protein
MVAVAIAALNCGAIRAMLGSPPGELVVLGALPMANVLAVGLLIGLLRRGSHPFLLGFEAFGVMALAFYLALTGFSPHPWVISYLELLLEPTRSTIETDRPGVLIASICSVAVVMLGLPQLTFALIGGFLSRTYRITITKRPAQPPAQM